MIRKCDLFIRCLIWYSIITYFIELSFKSENSLVGPAFFLWSERVAACLVSIELYFRIKWEQKPEYFRGMFWVDLIAVLPFWLGFIVPVQFLGWIRTLRVLRLLKLYRYNRNLQLLVGAFKRAWPPIKGALAAMLIVLLFASALLFQAEGAIQPDTFGHIGNCIYFTLTTAVTVGFGDMSAVTPLGKLITVVVLYGPAIFISASIIGIMAGSYQKELEEHEKKIHSRN